MPPATKTPKKTHPTRINMSNESLSQAQTILTAMNGQHGILGCLLVSVSDGKLLACSLPSDIDIGMIASLCATLFQIIEFRFAK